MIAILVFAGILGIGLFVLLARYAPPILGRRKAQLPLSSLRALTEDLLRAQGLNVEESGDQLLIATKEEPMGGELRYLVMVSSGPVAQAAVVALAEQVKAERASFGMLIAPAGIDAAGLAGLDVPLELIDGPRFHRLVARYLPERLGELDRYEKKDLRDAIRATEITLP